MRKTLLLASLGLCLWGCGAGSSDPGHPIAGKLTVHAGPSTPGQTVHVLLGDGRRFDQAPDAKGDVIFQDPSIDGPQTVTVVRSFPDGHSAEVTTVLGINRDEIWTSWSEPSIGGSFGNRDETISGAVTGIADPSDSVFVRLVSKHVDDFASVGTQVAANGTFQFAGNQLVRDADTAALIATEAGAGGPRRIGMRTDVPVDQAAVDADVALDHPFDRALSIHVDNLSSYASGATATLTASLGGIELFMTMCEGGSALSLPTIAMTAPFDGAALSLNLEAGSPTTLPSGQVSVTAPVLGLSSEITLPAPPTVLSPARGTSAAPTSVALAGLKASWNAGAPWGSVSVSVRQASGLDWWVLGPVGAQSFTFFPLPADAAPSAGFEPGPVEIDSGADSSTLEDRFASGPTISYGKFGQGQFARGFATLQ